MASKTISFRIFLHDQLVESRNFDQEVIKVGRLSSSHVRLDHEAIGRMHAIIEVGHDGNARLVDLGTSNGTRLNGDLVNRSHTLRSGDTLELGPYRVELAITDSIAVVERSFASAPITRPQPPADPAAHARIAVDLSKIEDSSEQVAEVVASYGRSILDVAHVGQTRSRKRSAVPLLVFGGVLLAGGVGLFGHEVAQPWDEYTIALAEAQKHHRELPAAPGHGTGSLGLLLGLMGIVPLLAGSLRLREQPLASYTIGEGNEANFKIDGAALPNPAATALVERVDGGYTLAFTPSMDGSVEFGGQQISLAELIASNRAAPHDGAYLYPLPANAKARVDHGEVRFNVNLVNRGAVVAGRGDVDWAFWGYFGGTATIATALYMLMRSMPDDALALQIEDDEAAARFASYFHQANESAEDEPVEIEPERVENSGQAGGESAARAPGSAGKMGDSRSRNTSGAYAMRGPEDASEQMARNYDPVAQARTAGILGIIAQQDSHFLASPTGGVFAVGNDDADLWGNIVGLEAAAAYGNGGLALVGSGRGGGHGSGLIGLGGFDRLGHGPGSGGSHFGDDDGGSEGVVGFGGRRKKIPVATVTKGHVTGDIDKSVIRRIVRAHLNEVRSCYNAGLTRNPNLTGRVTIQFSIIGTGKVGSSAVQANTTKDSSTANCIAKAVKRWKFPRVGNGGTALVSYPFRLTSR